MDDEPPLFERLGGHETIEAIVFELYDLMRADSLLGLRGSAWSEVVFYRALEGFLAHHGFQSLKMPAFPNNSCFTKDFTPEKPDKPLSSIYLYIVVFGTNPGESVPSANRVPQRSIMKV
ncbi:unnamed protein product [Durusdinium trenchii]|uniref:Uncharacterized protein n=1 Tax=Durusdinium trenchii TaxID=1381693 RepID=A0ABP0Q542_9DINO